MYRDLPDFDTLLTLHEENPDELEKIRHELTDAIFENAPEASRRRLEGLQFRINMELRKARTAQARCVKLSSMMHDSFAKLHHALHNPEALQSTQDAQILAFERRDKLKPRSH
ncbi:MAG: DUF3135 domain-containing protein [Pseudohongiellaceae bacterium]|nr:DUF3135 domain-containing protein [Pseudohongiellaceae bacterium]